MQQSLLFDSKQLSLPFTIGIIKPNTCLSVDKLKNIIETIQKQGFEIRNMIQRQLFKEQVSNVFYRHIGKSYFQDIVEYMLSGQCCVFLLTHQSEDPIVKWKKMIGGMEPEKAKKESPTSLRAIYGTSIIQNEFYGSDTIQQANKERQIFAFQQPQSPPQYIETSNKISFPELRKFLHPYNLQHPLLNERLDLFAMYGPVASWHSVQTCFCVKCSRVARSQLQVVKKQYPGKYIKLLKHKDIEMIKGDLCEKCHMHCLGYVHLFGGRYHQHVLTDIEINQMGKQLNRSQLLELLTIQKGAAAKTMIETIQIKQPKQVHYTIQIIQHLIRQLTTDYYGRYDFTQLQHLILQDRRIRMAYWIGKIVQKPVQSFPPVTSLDNTLTKKQLTDPKSPFFTLQRTKPLTMTLKKQELKQTPLNFNMSIVDKKKLHGIEMNLAVQKKLHRNLTKVSVVGEKNKDAKIASTMLREYNEGRNGDWDNYSGLKGNSVKQQVGGRFMGEMLGGKK